MVNTNWLCRCRRGQRWGSRSRRYRFLGGSRFVRAAWSLKDNIGRLRRGSGFSWEDFGADLNWSNDWSDLDGSSFEFFGIDQEGWSNNIWVVDTIEESEELLGS